MNSHRQRAKRKTVTWQAASLALLAGAIGLAASPLAQMLGPGKHKELKEESGSGASVRGQGLSVADVMRTVDVMKMLSGTVPVERVEEERNDAPEGESTAVEIAVAPSVWMYTGFMQGPRGKKAIVTVGPAGTGVQIALKEGEAHEGTKLLEIHPDHLLVEEAGSNQKRIEIAARSLVWDSTPPKRPMPARPAAGMPGMPGAIPGQPQSGVGAPNAAALAEAQRRMKAAIAPPQPHATQPRADTERFAKENPLDEEKRDSLMKVMTEPGLSPEQRGQLLREMGIPIDASPEERTEHLRNMGITEQSDPKLYEMLKEGGGVK